MGRDLWLMVSLVIISTIELDDWMPGSRAPGLFVFAPLKREKRSRDREWGTIFRLDSATLQNVMITQEGIDSRFHTSSPPSLAVYYH